MGLEHRESDEEEAGVDREKVCGAGMVGEGESEDLSDHFEREVQELTHLC